MDDSFHPVPFEPGGFAHVGSLLKNLPIRAAVPVPVGLGSHFLVTGELAKSLFHHTYSLSVRQLEVGDILVGRGVAMAYAMTKERAHALIDGLEPGRVPAAVAALELVAARVRGAKAEIPWEDELISEEEERVAADARAKGYAGEFVSHEELLKDFGMTPEDFERLVLEPPDNAVVSSKRG